YYTANTDGTAAGGFVPVAGKRIVDTRSGLGAPKALLAPGKSVDIQVTGTNGVPAGASGAVVNLLPINSTASDGYLTPYATGTTRPDNALHYAPSVNTSIQAQVRLSSSGKMTIYNGSSTINLVIDLQGYFTAAGTTGATFTPGIGRVFDSRSSGSSILAKNETRAIPVAGQAGVPVMGSGITAVVLTLTVAHGGSDGRASVWANGTTQPETTSINFQTDEIRTNTVTVALGANGKISLNNIADATNYIIDVQGWYVNPVAPTIVCPQPFAAGSVNTSLPETDINCTVTAPAVSETGTELDIDLNGDPLSTTELSNSRQTTVSVTVPRSGGEYVIDANLTTSTLDNYATSSYAFETGGVWPTETIQYLPGDALPADKAGILSVTTRNDVLRDYVRRHYVVTENKDGNSNAIYDSGWINGDADLATAGLVAGVRYYWHVDLAGPTSASTEEQSTTSPVMSFVASGAALDPACVMSASEVPGITDEDYTANCVDQTEIEEGKEDADVTEAEIVSDPDLTLTQKSFMVIAAKSSAIHSKTFNQRTDSPFYAEYHTGKFFYNGSRAWSTKKHQGKKGYHRCHTAGSLGWGTSVTMINCYSQRNGNSARLAEDFEVGVLIKGSPFSYVKTQLTQCSPRGKLTEKRY
ncbi:hypothetical protein ITJ58_18450, partial [Curtobacterium flaccumfaciens]|uniref:hypothetical protein n=1 Tax=Curtobacterium flaccumfaciens TaxID=2035 RepID=UPI00188C1DB0